MENLQSAQAGPFLRTPEKHTECLARIDFEQILRLATPDTKIR